MSYRTGARARQALIDAWTPNPNWSLEERLRARREYLQGIDRDLGDNSGAPIRYITNRTNAFHSIRVDSTGDMVVRKVINNSNRPEYVAYGPIADNGLVPAGSAGLLLNTVDTIGGLSFGYSGNTVQNYSSSMHLALNPLHNAMGIGETMLEIVTGNVPKLTSRFYKLLKEGDVLTVLKKAHKETSQDYLNYNFGLGPVFGDLYTLLVKGVVIHDALYGQSHRRSGQSPLETGYRSYSTNRGINMGGLTTRNQGDLGYYVLGGASDASSKTISYYQDMRFKARFTLARASDVANTFYDKALALIRNYGVWTPSLLWDIAPWSWLLDWFLHLGRGFQNAFDYGADGGLKSDYSCVTTKSVTQHSIPGRAYSRYDHPYRWDYFWSPIYTTTTVLRRYPTNPFGTFVELRSLSAWQQSILVALGIARRR